MIERYAFAFRDPLRPCIDPITLGLGLAAGLAGAASSSLIGGGDGGAKEAAPAPVAPPPQAPPEQTPTRKASRPSAARAMYPNLPQAGPAGAPPTLTAGTKTLLGQ